MEWKCFLLIYKFIMWWRFYSTVCAVGSTDCMLACIVGIGYTCWDADNSVTLCWHGSAQGPLALSQSVGKLPLECPGCLNSSVHITCGTSSAWPLAALRSNAGRSSAHSSRRIALKTADESVVIMCQQMLCLLTHVLFQLHHLQCLPIGKARQGNFIYIAPFIHKAIQCALQEKYIKGTIYH